MISITNCFREQISIAFGESEDKPIVVAHCVKSKNPTAKGKGSRQKHRDHAKAKRSGQKQNGRAKANRATVKTNANA